MLIIVGFMALIVLGTGLFFYRKPLLVDKFFQTNARKKLIVIVLVTAVFFSAPILLIKLVSSAHASSEADFFPNYNAWNRDDLGCDLNGERYQVGELAAMNSTDLDNFKKLTGFRATDGYAVMMMCSFVVDPSKQDYPTPDKRSFVWVAF